MDLSGALFDSKFPKRLWIWFLALCSCPEHRTTCASWFCPFTVWVLGWDSRHQGWQQVPQTTEPSGKPMFCICCITQTGLCDPTVRFTGVLHPYRPLNRQLHLLLPLLSALSPWVHSHIAASHGDVGGQRALGPGRFVSGLLRVNPAGYGSEQAFRTRVCAFAH